MYEFSPSGAPVTNWLVYSPLLAVDAQDNLYAYQLAEFKPNGQRAGLQRSLSIGNGYSPGIAVVDQSRDQLYALGTNQSQPNSIFRFDLTSCQWIQTEVNEYCLPAEEFGAGEIPAKNSALIGVDPNGQANTVYLAVNGGEGVASEVLALSSETVPDVVTGKATGFSANSTTLNGVVDPSGVELLAGVEGCRFEWGEHGADEAEAYGHVAPCDKTAAQIGSGSAPVEVHATIGGLQQGKTYHFRLVAANHNQMNELTDKPSFGDDLAFGPPAIEHASAIAVNESDTTLQAQVNPNNVDTSVRIEYGLNAGEYTHATSVRGVGSGGSGEVASFTLEGLLAGATYHYRVVAENALGEGAGASVGGDQVFTTEPAPAALVMPDGRAWEMVSPPDKRGGEPFGTHENGGVDEASVTGEAVTYQTTVPSEENPSGNPQGDQIFSRRTTSGWSSREIGLPHAAATGAAVGTGREYRFFSSDLSLGLVQPLGPFVPGLSAEASETTPFLVEQFAHGDVGALCATKCVRPIVTGAPGYENVPAETVFAPNTGCDECGPYFLGAANDLHHVVLTSQVPLTEGAPAGPKGHGEGELYEWGEGRLTLVSVLPNGQPASPITSQLPLGQKNGNARNAISNDGSRVVWSEAEASERLYVRDVTRKETVEIGSAGALYQAASVDDSKIVYTENEDLRQCSLTVDEEGALRCETTDLSPAAAGEKTEVVGMTAGASEDGSYVYFVANGVLQSNGVPVSGASKGDCTQHELPEHPASATCNLYVNHDGTIRLVARLSGDDASDWSDGGETLTSLTARVSPRGQWLAFLSDRSLTGYDTRDAVTGRPDMEVYLYDAAASEGRGALVCASCNPTGARPHGKEYTINELRGFNNVIKGLKNGQGMAGYVLGWMPTIGSYGLYQSRYLSDSGRLFFNGEDALVPQDTNGTGDVYEYEPAGAGDCTTGSTAFSSSANGCIGMVSSGTSVDEAHFVDASENGDDVFFLTSAKLSPSDVDRVPDLYDARVDGGFPEPQAPPVCEGDACQSPFAAPEDQTPGSLTYSGPGNHVATGPEGERPKQKTRPLMRVQKLAKAVRACQRKRSRRARTKCVQQAHRLYGRVAASTRAGGR
jgi:hypothetical protein